jgi:hypothetical protein
MNRKNLFYMDTLLTHQTILKRIRNSKLSRVLSVSLIIILLFGDVMPLMALSDGPTTPEASGFSSISPGEEVDLYSGDFNYTVPLFSMNDYPFTLSYNSNITMEQEASWVGLGWNLDIGSIDRQMRGLPDDAKGDTVKQEDNIRPNITVQLGIGVGVEFTGLKQDTSLIPGKIKKVVKKLTAKMLTIGFNNYKGFLWNLSGDASVGAKLFSKQLHTQFVAKAGIGFSIGSGGITLSPDLSLTSESQIENLRQRGHIGFGFNMNSAAGIQAINFNYGLKSTFVSDITKKNEKQQDVKVGEYNFDMGGNSGISYQLLSFPPSGNLSYKNFSGAVTVKVPVETFWSGYGTTFMGNFGMQKLSQNKKDRLAYGYFYMMNKKYSDDELTDVYREKDMAYMPGIPSLPQTHLQPDMFNVHTKGISGIYRAFKNTAQLTGDHSMTASKGQDIKLDFEFGGGNVIKGAINPTYGPAESTSDFWKDQNQAWSSAFVTSKFPNPFYNIYFKRINDGGKGLSVSYLNNIGTTSPVAYSITKNKFNYQLNNNLPNLFKEKYQQLPEEPTSFIPFTYGIISKHPLFNKLYQPYYAITPHSHQVTHIEITADEGKRFVFGCPAYNHIQKEVSFNVKASSSTYTNSTCSYTPSDASINNNNGLNHYYHSQTLPSYVYAYHLTEVYSEDYSDLKGDGPTPDDAGDYLLFHYSRKCFKYKWRSPMVTSTNVAQFNPGFISRDNDDMGMYSYGEKDIWYVDTVRSKYEMAVFYTSPRLDAKEAAGEQGGIGSQSLHRLDSIYVYDIQEWADIKQHPGNALRVKKRIRFHYDYSLCKGVPNSSSSSSPSLGKLTLKSVEIIDGYTYSGKVNRYQFSYSSFNPDYSLVNIDRWGNYKTADALKGLYPYTPQDPAWADVWATAWRLTRIELPGGGSIEITYEADRYAYVQNKKAMRMFKLVGIASAQNTFSISGNINSPIANNWLVFETDIPSSASPSVANSEFERYFQEDVMQKMYFKIKSKVNWNSSIVYPSDVYEYVQGFAEIWNKSVFYYNNKWYGCIQLKEVKHKALTYHPFQMATMQLVMTALPHFYQDDVPYSGVDGPVDVVVYVVSKVLNNLPMLFNQFVALLSGPFLFMSSKGIGGKIVPGESWIRLCVRNEKIGGGSRVKEIKYKNNWQNKTLENNAEIEYIKRYEYVLENGMCSGVAANEPTVGADETCLRVAQVYNNTTSTSSIANLTRALSPKIDYLYYYPLNETEFPAPSVGYSRVVVKNINPSTQPYKSKGWEIHEFFTDKDYPVIVQSTPLDEYVPTQNIPAYFVNIQRTHAVVSQGFSTLLNNMPGKKKRMRQYDGDGNLMSEHIYHYTLEKIPFMQKDHTISKEFNDLETEVVVDWREQKTIHQSFQLQANLDVSIIGIVPLPVPTGWPFIDYSETYFRSSTVNKTIYTYGTLIKEEVHERGADLTIFNRSFDIITGKVLIKSVREKFGKEEFSYELPAYFVYPQLGSASVSEGLHITLSTNSLGLITTSVPSVVPLTDGDQLLCLDDSNFYWVYKHLSSLYLIDKLGSLKTNMSNKVFVVYRSGFRNRLNESVEQEQMKLNPISGSGIQVNISKHILSASATTYTDYFSYPIDTCKWSCQNAGCSYTANILSGRDYSFSCTSSGSGSLVPIGTAPSTAISIPIDITVRDFCNCLGFIHIQSCSGKVDSIYVLSNSSSIASRKANKKSTKSIRSAENVLHQKLVQPDSVTNLSPYIAQLQAVNASCPNTCDGKLILTFTTVPGFTPVPGPYGISWSLSSCTPVPTPTLIPSMGTFTLNNVCPCPNGPYQVRVIPTPSIFITSNTVQVLSSSPPISMNVVDVIPSCNNQCNAQVLAQFSGGTLPYTITVNATQTVLVNNNSTLTTTTFSNICPGTNTFYVVDQQGCSATFTVNVNQVNGTHSQALTNLCAGTYTFVIKPHNRPPFSIYVTLNGGNYNVAAQPYFTVNPYVYHLRNAWRPYQSYILLTNRTPSVVTQPVQLPMQSEYTSFTKFWQNSGYNWSAHPNSWKLVHTITYCDINGTPIEERDILGNYSTAWYSVYRGLQEGVAYNARSEEVGFDSFEYYEVDSSFKVLPMHFYSQNVFPLLTRERSHTGLYSAKVIPNATFRYVTFITPKMAKQTFVANTAPPFKVYPYMKSDRWAPFDTTKTYLVSLWVYSTNSLIKPDTNLLQVKLNNAFANVVKIYETPSIEGWKQYRYKISWGEMKPKGCDTLKLIIKNTSSTTFYIDDIKFEPEDAESKVYVFHPFRKSLMAGLDENHFATMYLYNMRDELEKIIKETERGDIYVMYKKKQKTR